MSPLAWLALWPAASFALVALLAIARITHH